MNNINLNELQEINGGRPSGMGSARGSAANAKKGIDAIGSFAKGFIDGLLYD